MYSTHVHLSIKIKSMYLDPKKLIEISENLKMRKIVIFFNLLQNHLCRLNYMIHLIAHKIHDTVL